MAQSAATSPTASLLPRQFVKAPEVVVPAGELDKDYISYFAKWIQSIIDETSLTTASPPAGCTCPQDKPLFRHRRVIVTAGPYRSYDMSWTSDRDSATLEIDFYSVIRTRGSDITNEDIANLL